MFQSMCLRCIYNIKWSLLSWNFQTTGESCINQIIIHMNILIHIKQILLETNVYKKGEWPKLRESGKAFLNKWQLSWMRSERWVDIYSVWWGEHLFKSGKLSASFGGSVWRKGKWHAPQRERKLSWRPQGRVIGDAIEKVYKTYKTESLVSGLKIRSISTESSKEREVMQSVLWFKKIIPYVSGSS